MGNSVVDAKLNHLRIHHNELHVLRACLVQQADDDGVHAHGLTGTGGTGNEHMGHFCNVTDNAAAANVLTHRERGLGLGFVEFGGIDDFPQGDSGHRTVGHFDTYHRNLTGHSRDTDTGSTKAQCDVIGTGGQLIQADTLLQFHLIAGYTGATGHVDNVSINLEAGQSLIQAAAVFPHFCRAIQHATAGTVQKVNWWEAILHLLYRAGLSDFLCHKLRGYCCILGCDFVRLHFYLRRRFRLCLHFWCRRNGLSRFIDRHGLRNDLRRHISLRCFRFLNGVIRHMIRSGCHRRSNFVDLIHHIACLLRRRTLALAGRL